MSKGMHIFETAVRDLEAMHSEENLRELDSVSGDYYATHQKLKQLQQELAAELTSEQIAKLHQLEDHFSELEFFAQDIYYHQGFADGISLLTQSLMWEAVRR
ncbi:putative nuclease with TOPRIM domain [Sporomusaceae bacterium BoRhaA]|uniref:hypothetical protein n=1 Tax=Pelorhabdus rhamnosifermentans TaxID=2772457 RepID=UPI001C064991|nr:hypothetical protein [Pelorhabdus rhamnosifermentans]MBU2699053.1 putative nuclease with TOPRIM domain [Pelorhabdus rhamnosifermentans]